MDDNIFNNYQTLILDYFSESPLLSQAFRFFIDNNMSFDAPYHNVNHTLTMAYLIYTFTNEEDLPDFNIQNISNKDLLLLCAIFHDFGHSHGKFDDNINIDNAIIALDSFIKHWNSDNRDYTSYLIPKDVVRSLHTIIKATQCPYLYPAKEYPNNACRIIREADILVALNDDYFTQCICGLKSEMNKRDMAVMVRDNNKFIIDSLKTITYPPFVGLVTTRMKDFKKKNEIYYRLFN